MPTKREVRRAVLAERITHFFTASGGTYGSPRITQDMWAEGWTVSVNTVAELMAELGLQGRKPKKRRSLTGQGKRRAVSDQVWRHFDAVAPNVLWVEVNSPRWPGAWTPAATVMERVNVVMADWRRNGTSDSWTFFAETMIH